MDFGDLSSPIGSDLECSPDWVIRTKIREQRKKPSEGLTRVQLPTAKQTGDDMSTESEIDISVRQPKTATGFIVKEMKKVRYVMRLKRKKNENSVPDT